MSLSNFLEAMNSSIKYHKRSEENALRSGMGKLPRLFITISRQPGAGAITIGEKIAEFLNNDKKRDWLCPWTVFDEDLVKKVLEDHHLPEKCKEYMPEDKISKINDILDELFGVHPPAITLVRKTSETILSLAQMGSVILVGRGAGIITRELKGGLHVRLVGSLEKCTQRIVEFSQVDRKKAEKLVANWDKGRRKYIKEYFNKDINDPLLYDLIINTDHISYDHAAKIIVDAALHSSK